MPRDPRQIQLEIDAARESLAATLDQLADRTGPKRLAAEAKDKALAFLQSPAGIALVGGLGVLVTIGVVRKARHHKQTKPKAISRRR